jgi:hypothetical protein
MLVNVDLRVGVIPQFPTNELRFGVGDSTDKKGFIMCWKNDLPL